MHRLEKQIHVPLTPCINIDISCDKLTCKAPERNMPHCKEKVDS